MTIPRSIPHVYAKLGVRPVIHGAGTTTRYGGSLMRPETIEAMREAAQVPREPRRAQRGGGGRHRADARRRGRARHGRLGRRASCSRPPRASPATTPPTSRACPTSPGCATSSSSSAPSASATTRRIACPAASSSRSGSGGARWRGSSSTPSASGRRASSTSSRPSLSPPGVLGFEEVCRIAHARGVPVLVDAASMIPPRDNLFRYLRGGADLVIFSGGKGIRGPQSTGHPRRPARSDPRGDAGTPAPTRPSAGRRRRRRRRSSASSRRSSSSSPRTRRRRWKGFRAISARIVDGVADIPGIMAVVEQDPVNRVLPQAVIYFEASWTGPSGRAVQLALAAGDPHIYVQQGPHQGVAMATRSPSTPSTCSRGTTPSS